MKKILVAAVLLFAGIASTFAGDRERPIAVDKLPAVAQQFLAAHFKGLTVAFAVEDPKFIGSEYEVTYTDRTEVDFRSDGEWSSVERKYEAVPASVVPAQLPEPVYPEDRAEQVHLGDRAFERARDQVRPSVQCDRLRRLIPAAFRG